MTRTADLSLDKLALNLHKRRILGSVLPTNRQQFETGISSISN
jgi:hypothetical protein